MLDEDEAMQISALGATLPPELFENASVAAQDGLFRDGQRNHTRVVDGACIFFNRSGFSGGTGCALHLAAVADGESPLDWKPSVCWQLPLKVDRRTDAQGSPTAHLRRWNRSDWGPGGADMAWCCTERTESAGSAPDAYRGAQPVAISMAAEIEAIVGPEAAEDLLRQVATRTDTQ